MNYEDFFQKSKEKKFDSIQVTEKHIIDSSVEIINGELESFDDYDNVDYHIKAESQGKTVKAVTNYLGEEVLNSLMVQLEFNDSKYEDEYLEVTENLPVPEVISFDISEEIKQLKNLESIRKDYPQVVKMTSYFDENYTNTRIVNSDGVDISTDSHLCRFSVEVVIQNGEKFTSFDRQILMTNKKEIPIRKLVEEVIKMGILGSNQKKLETKKYDIVLDSSVMGNILRHLVSMASAFSIRKKISCFENQLNQKIFSDKITILEDPINPHYPGYRLFDDEGVRTFPKTVVEEGFLKTYFYNIKEAKIQNISSTGNGYEGIDTRNMILVPGEKDLEELLHSMGDGIYIVDYMGASGTSINPLNGDISLQVFGFLVENGKIVSGIETSIMTTTIFELFSHVEEIGKDLNFTRESVASPSLYVRDISIAG